MYCILCGSENILIKKNYRTRYLKYHYKKQLNIDIFYDKDIFSLYECINCSLRYFDTDFKYNNEFYEQLSKFDWYYQLEKNEYKIIANYLSGNMNILDIGAGIGNFSKLFNFHNYLGLEPSLKQEIVLENGAKIIPKTIQDISNSFFEFFDVVVMFQILEHLKDPKSFIEEALKVLKKNGLIIISVPNNNSYLKFHKNAILNFPPHHFIRWDAKSLLKLTNLFNLRNPLIFDCPLDEIHMDSYSHSISSYMIENLFFFEPIELSNSFRQKIINKFSLPLKFLIKNLIKKNVLQPIGHSIIAIFRK